MKDICLTYLDSDVRSVKYLLSFFRVIGIYVNERIISDGKLEEISLPFEKPDKDIDVMLAGSSEIAELLERYRSEDTIFILTFSRTLYSENNPKGYIKNINVLLGLIQQLALRYQQFGVEIKNLNVIANIFDKCCITETLLGTRYFYPDKNNYEILCPNYKNAIEQIVEVLKNNYRNNVNSNFLWFAMAYLGYEYNYYCKRLNQGFRFSHKDLLGTADDLWKSEKEVWKSVILLKAQVYDDLEGKAPQAYEFYKMSVVGKFNAFAWYKMGNIWQKKYRDRVIALKHFEQAVRINPLYYRAVYKVAECNLGLENIAEARDAYWKVIEILQNRYKRVLLCPIDVEYLYKSYVNLARIEVNKYGDIFEAMRIYEQIEELWEKICDSSDTEDICSKYIAESGLDNKFLTMLYKGLKSKLNIKMLVEERISLQNMISLSYEKNVKGMHNGKGEI